MSTNSVTKWTKKANKKWSGNGVGDKIKTMQNLGIVNKNLFQTWGPEMRWKNVNGKYYSNMHLILLSRISGMDMKLSREIYCRKWSLRSSSNIKFVAIQSIDIFIRFCYLYYLDFLSLDICFSLGLKLNTKNKALSQKILSYLGAFIWNGLSDDVKISQNVNTFKFKSKRPSRHC